MRKAFFCLFLFGALRASAQPLVEDPAAQPGGAPANNQAQASSGQRRSATAASDQARSTVAASDQAGPAGTAADQPQPGVDKSRVMDYFQSQNFDDAISYLSPLLKADSNNISALGYAGYAYYMSDDSRNSAACFRHLLTLDSNNVNALHYLVLLTSNDDSYDALRYGRRLVNLQPERAGWWRTMGELWHRKNKPDSALFWFDSAYAMAPMDLRTMNDLAEVLVEQKTYDRADSIIALGLIKDSLNIGLLRLQVKSAYQTKNYNAVLKPGQRLLGLEDPNIASLTSLALAYYNLKSYGESIRVCEAMQALGLQSEAIYYYESRAYARSKDYVKSNELLRLALAKAINKTAEWYYDDLGNNCESLKDYKKAVANYDTAYYLFKDPLTLYTCGRICETELHNQSLARAYYRRYLALANPVSAEEKQAYRYVKQRWGAHASK